MKKEKIIVFVVMILCLLTGCTKESYITMEEVTTEIAEEQGSESQKETEANETIFVDMCGAVKKPSVYQMPKGSRLFEAVEAAGGFLEEAEENCENKARILIDGEQIYIMTKAEVQAAKEAGVYPTVRNEALTEDKSGTININTASQEELCKIPGIGRTRALSIIAYREEHGSFNTIEDIKDVSGIKDGLYEKMKEFIAIK